MQELETLLNKLIKMGWKPFGEENVKIEKTRNGFRFRSPLIWGFTSYSNRSLRELVSLESQLWQFCEKNGLLHEYYNGRSNIHPYKCYWTTTYEYRLLESALVPEEELGKFLIDNIKIEGMMN